MRHKINSRVEMKIAECAILLCIMAAGANAISFDVSPSQLNYGALQPGSSTALTVTLYIRSNKSLMCSMSADDTLKDWVVMHENPTTLTPYKAKTIYVNLTLPANIPAREYNGKIYFSIIDQSESEGMSVSLGFSMPVSVYFIIQGNESTAYQIKSVEITGEKNKILVIKESNTGSSLLAIEHNIKISAGEKLVSTLAYKNNILPLNSKTTEVDLNTTSLPEGTYDVRLSVAGKDVQANKTLQFTITPPGTATTTTLKHTPQSTQPPLTSRQSTNTLLYTAAVAAAVLALGGGAYLLLRKRRRPTKNLPMPK